LLLAAAISSGPHVTRHHYHHHHVAPVTDDLLPGSTPSSTVDATPNIPTSPTIDSSKSKYQSQQAPRSQKPKYNEMDSDKENRRQVLGSAANLPRRPRGSSVAQNSLVPIQSTTSSNAPAVIGAGPPPPSPFILSSPPATLSKPVIQNLPPAPLQVQCMARTRIPTPHGPACLHLYRNNKDAKEHLAFVIDPAQLDASEDVRGENSIRSASLDAKWSEDETELDRLTRGAYIGRLTPHVHKPSSPNSETSTSTYNEPTLPPLVRIHSECFTGETIGSMRCDCGEQLDEALRLISLPPSSTSPGRGAVIYLRQEGRGIGLLSKIRAYNLQDMGHDTVQANILLGHGADERRYDIAAAIMRDLGLDQGVELLTNNPDKVKSLEEEGINVAKRRGMVPRSWQQPRSHPHEHDAVDVDAKSPGATLIGGGAAHGPELEKYLRTKVKRMGHMLKLPSADIST
jgi:GTP cyclohydrolase II